MDKIQPYLDEYKIALMSGGVAVVVGYLGKKVLKRDLLPVQGLKRSLETFAVVAASGIAARQIEKNMRSEKKTS